MSQPCIYSNPEKLACITHQRSKWKMTKYITSSMHHVPKATPYLTCLQCTGEMGRHREETPYITCVLLVLYMYVAPNTAAVRTVDVKKTFPKSFTVPPFNGVYRCTVSPFPAERLSTVRSLPFTSATPQLVRRVERSRGGELWGRERRLFLRTVGAIGLSQTLERVKMRFATSIL